MDNMLLPIGTVCTLKDSSKKLMITSFMVKKDANSDKYYDYCGCLYPEGIVNSDEHFVFDKSDIKAIHHLGYFNQEEEEFKENLYKMIAEEQSNSSNNVIGTNQIVNNNSLENNFVASQQNVANSVSPSQFFSNQSNN